MREEEALYKAALEHLNAYARTHEMRASKVRNLILRRVCRLKQPFTAEQLEAECSEERISKATIYNALQLFLDAEMLNKHERMIGQPATLYELVTKASRVHMYLLCTKCGRRAAFYDKAMMQLVKERNYPNFNIQNYTLAVYGECKICRRLTSVKTRK